MNNNRIQWFSMVRSTGLMLVLIYHFFKKALPGGFVGVDVFFVFSGYLITSIVISEIKREGYFNLFAFVKRRFMRIFPPLFLSVLITLPFLLIISTDITVGIDRQIAAAIGFVTNYFEISNGGSYEAQLVPHVYIHTWSLAVEMQFYLLWAIVCAICYGVIFSLAGVNNKTKLASFKCVLFIISVTFAAVGYFSMRVIFERNATEAYFSFLSHSMPLMIGAAGACLFGTDLSKKARQNLQTTGHFIFGFILIAVSLAALVFIALKFDFESPFVYKYGFLFVSLAALLMIFAARIWHEAIDSEEPKWLSLLAELSYSIYLFHWPLHIVFSRVMKPVPAALATFALSFIFSFLVCRCAEPIIHGKVRVRKIAVPVLAGILLIPAILGYPVIKNMPEINALEEQIKFGYLYQDTVAVGNTQKAAASISGEPINTTEGYNTVQDLVDGITEKPNFTIPSHENPPPISQPGEIKLNVTYIGDSVSLGANRQLNEAIENGNIDTLGNRSMSQGYEVVMGLQNSGQLGEYVVVALGTNWWGNDLEYIDKFVANIESGHHLIFVTPYNGGKPNNSYKVADYERTLPEKYPWVSVADWAYLIAPQDNILGFDQIHLGGYGPAERLYTDNVVQALKRAETLPKK